MSTSSIGQMADFVKSFNTVIDACRDILRKEGITGMDSMKHLTLYILARALDKEECKRLNLDEKFAWEKFLELVKLDKKQYAFDLLYNKEDGGLIATLDDLFGTRNFNFKLNSPDNHASILKHLDKINFKALDGTVDILGTVYENHLGSGSNKSAMRDLGQFFTDRKVCAYMTKLCDPKTFDDGTAESVLDPTMGTGGFLTAYVKFLKEHGATVDWNTMQMDIAGYDIDEFVMSIGLINMYLSTGVIFKRIQHRNSLNLDVGDLDQRLKFKVILANMPFGVKGLIYKDCCKRVKDLGINGTKSEPLFLNLMMAALDEDGRCAVVVPDGVLVNNSNQHNGTRKYLLDNFELKRVIKMKGQFFSNTGIQPSILFFENTGNPTTVVEFWEVEQDSDGEIIEKMMLSVPRSKFDDSCSLDMRRYQEVAAVVNPAGFSMVKLSDICNDVSTSKNIPSSERKNGEFRFFTCSRDYSSHNEYHYDGTYLIHGSRGSTISESVFATDNEKFSIGTSMFVSEVKDKNKVNTKYLYYYLKFNKAIVDTHVNSSAIPMISKTSYYTIEVLLPPLPIQQEIVTALDLIYNNAATAKAAAASVKSQMAAVVRSVGARGFERKKLGDIATLNPENISKNENIPVINYIDLGSVKEGVISNIQSFMFNDKPGRAQRKVKNNDILWGSVRPLSKSYTFIESPLENTIVSTGFVVVRNNNETKNLSKYIYYMLTSDECVQYLSNHSGGSSYPAFNSDILSEYQIPCPPLPIQHEVLAILNEMEAELATLEQMATKAEQRAKFILDGYLTHAPVAQPEPVVAVNKKIKKTIPLGSIRDE